MYQSNKLLNALSTNTSLELKKKRMQNEAYKPNTFTINCNYSNGSRNCLHIFNLYICEKSILFRFCFLFLCESLNRVNCNYE